MHQLVGDDRAELLEGFEARNLIVELGSPVRGVLIEPMAGPGVELIVDDTPGVVVVSLRVSPSLTWKRY